MQAVLISTTTYPPTKAEAQTTPNVSFLQRNALNGAFCAAFVFFGDLLATAVEFSSVDGGAYSAAGVQGGGFLADHGLKEGLVPVHLEHAFEGVLLNIE